MPNNIGGIWGKVLRLNLTEGKVREESVDEAVFRKYLGGVGLGMKYLLEEVNPKLDWSNPTNILFAGSGPLGGTHVPGSGAVCFVTKGAMTNGAASSQANGFFGAYLKFCGYDAVIVQGASTGWKYLYIHKGGAELRDATHLLGKDTWQTEEAIKEELGYKETAMSVYSIGPAGEHLVRFAGIIGDKGHAAAHNGLGAVMGSKRLKAFAVARGNAKLLVSNSLLLSEISRQMREAAKNFGGGNLYNWGTSRLISGAAAGGYLPVQNYLTNLFPEHELFVGDRIRSVFETKNYPCYACASRHRELMKVTEGPYAGYFGKEPEYEQWAAWGPQILQKDPGTALRLANEVDRLGMDTNEAGWVIGWVMECYNKGLLNSKEIDGLDMSWGNAEATLALLRNIAHRRGFGDLLAEGVKRAAEKTGGEASKLAIFTGKGNTPRGHDHRGRWVELLDTCVSETGTMETQLMIKDPKLWGVPQPFSPFDAEQVAIAEANSKGSMHVSDSLVQCLMQGLNDTEAQTKAVNAATGWNLSSEEMLKIGKRTTNMMRLFNLRAGLTPNMEKPSLRYGSTPIDGPNKGKAIEPHWELMLDKYYKLMGWDRRTGMPLPQTIKDLGLEEFSKS